MFADEFVISEYYDKPTSGMIIQQIYVPMNKINFSILLQINFFFVAS